MKQTGVKNCETLGFTPLRKVPVRGGRTIRPYYAYDDRLTFDEKALLLIMLIVEDEYTDARVLSKRCEFSETEVKGLIPGIEKAGYLTRLVGPFNAGLEKYRLNMDMFPEEDREKDIDVHMKLLAWERSGYIFRADAEMPESEEIIRFAELF
jgi:hypothetical protein